jgi:hypothetical protein
MDFGYLNYIRIIIFLLHIYYNFAKIIQIVLDFCGKTLHPFNMENKKLVLVIHANQIGRISFSYEIAKITNAITVNMINKEYRVGDWISEDDAKQIIKGLDFEVTVINSKD